MVRIQIWKALFFSFLTCPVFSFALSLQEANKLGDRILKRYVSVKGPYSTVNYKALKENTADLDAYLEFLRGFSEKKFKEVSEKEQLAFLINAYNFYTLKLIVVKYPVKSIKDIGNLFITPWKKRFSWLKLFGKKISLDDIEHRMIRGSNPEDKLISEIYNEPRIHFAVNCASVACPALRQKVYRGETLDASLDKVSRVFLQDSSRNRYDKKKAILYLSPIFNWYKNDFGKSPVEVKRFVLKYLSLSPKDKKAVLRKGVKIEYTEYNWTLNE